MARNNQVKVKGNLTGDIYYDVLQNKAGQSTPFMRFYLMINAERGVNEVRGLRVLCYGKLAEYAEAHLQKGSKVIVDGHIQMRTIKNGGNNGGNVVFEIVADDIDFVQHIDWERGRQKHNEMVGAGSLDDSFSIPIYYSMEALEAIPA